MAPKRKRGSNVNGNSKRKKIRKSSPPPSSSQSSQSIWAVKNIIAESDGKYLIDWEDAGGKSFEPTWEPKKYANEEAVRDWESEKAKQAQARQHQDHELHAPENKRQNASDNEQEGEDAVEDGEGEILAMIPHEHEPLPKKRGRPRKSQPLNEVAPIKRGRGRPRKSVPENLQPKRPRGRPRKHPAADQSAIETIAIESDDEEDQVVQELLDTKGGAASRNDASAVYNVESNDEDEGEEPSRRLISRNHHPILDDSDDEPVSYNPRASADRTTLEATQASDLAAAQLQREAQSVQPSAHEDISNFHSSQVIIGTQPETFQVEIQDIEDTEELVDAAAASSLSQKNSAYEPGNTSKSTVADSSLFAVNSSSGVHTLILPPRFGGGVIIPDSQGFLDASSVHISEHQLNTNSSTGQDQGDPAIEDHAVQQGPSAEDQDVPESSIVKVISNVLFYLFVFCFVNGFI